MTPESAARTIEDAIESLWIDGFMDPLTPISWPNVPFIVPAGPWLKVDFVWGSGAILTKDNMSGVVGILQLAIFGRRDRGDGPLYTLAETARGMFNRDDVLDVAFGVPSGPVVLTDESWRQLVVSVPFTVRETI